MKEVHTTFGHKKLVCLQGQQSADSVSYPCIVSAVEDMQANELTDNWLQNIQEPVLELVAFFVHSHLETSPKVHQLLANVFLSSETSD